MCLCTSRVGIKTLQTLIKMDSEKESENLQAIDTAARMDRKRLPGAIAWQLIRLVPPI